MPETRIYTAGQSCGDNGGTLAELTMNRYAMTSCRCIFIHNGIARLRQPLFRYT